jgi:hypothetical protein
MTAPTAPTSRAGDREREQTANQLGSALAQGYLTLDEYETRLQAAFAVGLTAGAWYFWPVWPILGAGIGVLGHALPNRIATGCGARRR